MRLGKLLGGMLAPKTRLSQIETPFCPKLSHFWVRIWGSIFELFRDFWIRFCDLFSRLRFGSYKYRFWKDFGRFLASILEGFRYSFWDRWEVSEMSFWYIIYYVWSTSASWTNKRKFVYFSYMISDLFEDGYRQRLVIDLGWIWGPFWEAFGRRKP